MFKSMKFKSLLFLFALMGSTLTFAQDISDTQLAQFADAYIKVQEENEKAQHEMIAVVEKEGLEIERFSAIQQAAMDPSQESNVTPEEMEKVGNAMTKLEAMQPELEKKAIAGIESTGITLEQFQAIGMAIEQDATLQQKLQTILMERVQQ